MAKWYIEQVGGGFNFELNSNPKSEVKNPSKAVQYATLISGQEIRITAPTTTMIKYGSMVLEIQHVHEATKGNLDYVYNNDLTFKIKYNGINYISSIKNSAIDGKWKIDLIGQWQREPKKFYIKGNSTLQQGYTTTLTLKEVA